MSKTYTSEDEKISLRNEDITHVCIAPSLYPLMQYILLKDIDTVKKHTFYIFTDVISKDIRKHLPCVHYKHDSGTFSQNLKKRLDKFAILLFKYCRFPFLKTAKIYALDMTYTCLFIGKREYDLLSDGPGCLTSNMQENCAAYIRQKAKANSLVGRIQRLVFGDVFINNWGNNKQCQELYMTEENVSPIVDSHKTHVKSLKQMWNEASEETKDFLLEIFSLDKSDIESLNSRPLMFFTQPMTTDCGMSENEYAEVLKKMLGRYDNTQLIIKTHPRDRFDYQSLFPDALVYRKAVNAQLLELTGVKPKKVITICSSSVEAFSEDIECDYFGSDIHPKIEHHFGKEYFPNRTFNKVDMP
ncbi:MAG: hypothetical protein J6U33_03250 [Paludibacteraceae bacterium]|nr:hypothetical protein [Paludibacteraceae bacterium]